MSGFWYPYSSFADAQRRLCAFADHTVQPGCGVSYSDGTSLAVVRRPGNATSAVWLNVLRRRAAAPAHHPAAPQGIVQRMETWFSQAVETIGQAENQRMDWELTQANSFNKMVHDDVWLPAHQFLQRHKLAADFVAVGLDVVGVVAGGFFVAAALPALAGGAAILGTTALITGGLASAGSLVLLGIDGAVFGGELAGDEELVKQVEGSSSIGWLRVVATVMLLPDLPVGGARALSEIGKLGAEAKEAGIAARSFDTGAEAQRARIERIHNPNRHPGPVNRHLARARKLAHAAEEKRTEIGRLHRRMTLLATRDVNASFVATPGSGGLLVGLPPGVLMSKEGIERDEKYMKLLAPEHGMPADTRLEARVSGVSRMKHEQANHH